MVNALLHAIRGWPIEDRRAIALALVNKLPPVELGEVIAAARKRLEKHGARDDKSRGRISKTA